MSNEVKLIKHTKRDLVEEFLWFKDDETLPEIIERLGPSGEGWDINPGNISETMVGAKRAIQRK